jgi:hypothetical protein
MHTFIPNTFHKRRASAFLERPTSWYCYKTGADYSGLSLLTSFLIKKAQKTNSETPISIHTISKKLIGDFSQLIVDPPFKDIS